MAIKDLTLTIRPKFDGAGAVNGLKTQSKLIKDQKKDIGELGKTQNKVLGDAAKGLKSATNEAEKFSFTFKGAFRQAKSELEQFGRGVETLKSKLVSLKTIVVGSAIGGLAIAGINKLLTGGMAEQKATGRINREFGADAKFLQAQAALIARQSGISREAALKAIIPVAETTQETQAGTTFRGRKLNAAQAGALRQQTTKFGAGLLSRIATVTGAGGDELADLAQAIAEGGAGPEGTRRFVSAIGGNRVFARELSAANQKGQIAKFLAQRGFSADRLKGLGIKNGQIAGQGTVLDIIAQQSGITDQAAEAKRHSFGFQRQAIGASIDTTLGEIGASALDKLTKSFGKGKTLAEKFQEVLESEKGKKVIDGIASAIDKVVEGLVKVATEIPKIIGFISQHKTAFEILGGGLVLGKGISMGAGLIGGAKDVFKAFGIGGGAGKLVEGAMGSKPIPVYVVNAPALGGEGGIAGAAGGAKGLLAKAGLVAGAGLAGYAAGKFLDSKFGLSTKLANGVGSLTGQNDALAGIEAAGVGGNQRLIAQRAKNKSDFVRQLEATGLQHGQAVYVAEHGAQGAGFAIPEAARALAGGAVNVNPTINVNLDGRTLATVTAPHIVEHVARRVRTESAGGAAPGGGT